MALWFARFTGAAPAAWPAPVYQAEDGSEACTYVADEHELARLAAPLSIVRLQPLLAQPGAAAGAHPRWHYVVATDVDPAMEGDFNRWYDSEHLPGLAAVPGTVQAARHRVDQGPGPRYHACYDLADRAAFNSPAWLAVRGTAWSSRVRPAFCNTRRTMYMRVG